MKTLSTTESPSPLVNLLKNFDGKINFTSLVRSASFAATLLLVSMVSYDVEAQTYTGNESWTDGGSTYDFDYVITCGTPPTVSITFNSAPMGLNAQVWIDGGPITNMTNNGGGMYSFDLPVGASPCDFSFRFRMEYQSGGLYASPVSLNPTTLPVELADFAARLQGEHKVMLNWTTTAEINSSYFSVERSKDGHTWLSVGEVKAAGFSDELQSYGFLDEEVDLSRSILTRYYRLKMVDLDASYEYSTVRAVSIDVDGKDLTAVYPNPATSEINVSLSTPSQLSIVDYTGQAIRTLALEAGSHTLQIDDLPNGMYIITSSTGTTQRFVKH